MATDIALRDDEHPLITFYDTPGGRPAIEFHDRLSDEHAEIRSRFFRRLSAQFLGPTLPVSPFVSHDMLLASHQLALAATRQAFFYWDKIRREDDTRHYRIPLIEAFSIANSDYPGISIDPEVMAGAPCVAGTRIPVYMILDAVEYSGLEGALESYPRLTLEQVKQAVGFAKMIVECPIEHEDTVTP
jgi:uncharacterized protein (DUF433 family)